MSKSNAFETDLLLLVFNNTNIADIGDATGLRGSTTVGSLFISIHTADPGEAGNQSTNEIAYTGYGRIALARTAGNFSVSGNAVSFVNNVDFGTCTAGSGTATHFGIGVASSGSAKLLYKGVLSASIAVALNVTPRINAGQCVTED